VLRLVLTLQAGSKRREHRNQQYDDHSGATKNCNLHDVSLPIHRISRGDLHHKCQSMIDPANRGATILFIAEQLLPLLDEKRLEMAARDQSLKAR
jgi:hypothetical protein